MIVKVNSREKHIHHTVSLWGYYHKLTSLEHKLLCTLIGMYLDLTSKTTDQSIIDKMFIDSEARKVLESTLSMSQPTLTVYLTSLIKKKALNKVDGTYIIPKQFIPTDKIVIEYVRG